MNKKKIIATVLSLCIVGGSVPVYNNFVSDYSITASAYETVTDGYLTFTVYDDYAEVSKCDEAAEGEIIVPSEINGVPVTSIGEKAFYFCSTLTAITIPESITSIGERAFSSCLLLKSITIPKSVTNIGDYAFYGCLSLESIIIPDSVTSIGDYTFSNCYYLTSITIPESVTSIGNFSFEKCSSLVSITIPDSVTSIGYYAFWNCSSLTSITIPESVTIIRDYAFWGCLSLTSITIPESVTSIRDGVFNCCSSLTSITIPDNVTSIGNGAFENCSSLTSITIPNSVTSIGYYAFGNCSILESITILNPKCEIYNDTSTICNGYDDDFNHYFNGTIYGYEGSTAQEYAEKYGYNFAVIGEGFPTTEPTTETVTGDSNCDGQITLADAVAILQYVANPDKYPLSEQGLVNADCYNTGDGITGMDALAIQMYDSRQIDSLPYNP